MDAWNMCQSFDSTERPDPSNRATFIRYFVYHCYDKLRAYALSRLGARSIKGCDANDVAHESVMRAARAASGFKQERAADPCSWLIRIASNYLSDLFREGENEIHGSSEQLTAGADSGSISYHDDHPIDSANSLAKAIFYRAVSILHHEHSVMIDYVFKRNSPADAAARLQISEKNVRTKGTRLRRRFLKDCRREVKTLHATLAMGSLMAFPPAVQQWVRTKWAHENPENDWDECAALARLKRELDRLSESIEQQMRDESNADGDK